MRGKDEKVTTELGHVDRHMRHRLAAVQEHRNTRSTGLLDNRLGRIDGPERVRDMDDGKKLGPLGQQAVESFQIEFASLSHRNHLERRPGLLRGNLPGHDIGMVLHVRDENFITRLQNRFHEAVRHEIDALGRATGKYDLVRVRRADQAGHFGPGVFVGIGRLFAQVMHATMDVGIFLRVVARQCVDHRLRLLRSGPIVQIGQWLTPHLGLQYGKIGACLRVVECWYFDHVW